MKSDGFQSRSLGGEPVRRPAAPLRPLGGGQAFVPRRALRRGPSRNPITRGWEWLKRQQQELGWKHFLLRAGGVCILLGILYFGFLWLTLPSIDQQTILRAAQSTTIVDRNGIELYRVFDEQDRTIVNKDQISPFIKQGVVAIEDKRFYDRGCIDMRALARAVFGFGQKGGASTLTRQLARNALNLQGDNIINRKLKEIILGCELESRYSRDDLLALYLNWVPFGQNAYGVEQASHRYFGKSAKDLTLGESAVLAGIPQAPSYYSPYGRHVHTTVSDRLKADIASGKITKTSQIGDNDFTIGLLGSSIGSGSHVIYIGGRTDQVLQNMLDQKMITLKDRDDAVRELQSTVFKPTRESIRAPHFVLWLKDQVEKMFEGASDKGLLEQGGLTIQTTLDWNLQQAAEAAVAKYKDVTAKTYQANNIALVAMDPKTKEILAYVGNSDYNDDAHQGKVDMALVPRAPGSSFKPFVYAGAFLNGYGPATVLHDVQTDFGGGYTPQNYEGGFWGLTTIRRALAGSRNIPAIKAYFLAGEEDKLLTLVEKMGVTTPKKLKPAKGYGPSMAIGTAESPLLEMVQGYATLADAGKEKPAVSIRKITGKNGVLLYESDPSATEGDQALDPRVAFEITSILSDTAARPTDYWSAALTVPGTAAAAKTGTSNKCLEYTDAKKQNCKKRKPDNVWTMGYTPSLVAGVWVGNATSDALSDNADGLNVAAPIWKEFMTQATKLQKPTVTSFKQPDGIVQVQTSLLSGQLPSDCTPITQRKAEIFLSENAPTEQDPACQSLTIDKVTGLLSSPSCPVSAQEKGNFYVPHSLLGTSYPKWEQAVQAWAHAGSGAGMPLPVAPTEQCDVSKTPGRLVQPTITLLSPANGGSAAYPSFHPAYSSTVGSSIRQVDVLVDGKPAASFVTAPFNGPVRVPRSVSRDGSHVLTVTLTDQFYNTATATATISFSGDTGGPSLTLTSPQDGAILAPGTSVTVRAESDDAEGGVKYVEFYADNVLITRKPKAPYEMTYTTPTVPGPHTLKVMATDLAGNESTDEVQFTVSDGSTPGLQ